MRKVALALVIMLMYGFVSLANVSSVYAEDTSRGNYTTPIEPATDWLNNNGDFFHNHSYDRNSQAEEYKDPLGVGLDVKVFDFGETTPFSSVVVEGRRDFNNDEWSAFAVLQLDLTRLYKK